MEAREKRPGKCVPSKVEKEAEEEDIGRVNCGEDKEDGEGGKKYVKHQDGNDDEEEEDEDQREIFGRKELPLRLSRGSRYHELLGYAEKRLTENDNLYYRGDIWNESSDDDEWHPKAFLGSNYLELLRCKESESSSDSDVGEEDGDVECEDVDSEEEKDAAMENNVARGVTIKGAVGRSMEEEGALTVEDNDQNCIMDPKDILHRRRRRRGMSMMDKNRRTANDEREEEILKKTKLIDQSSNADGTALLPTDSVVVDLASCDFPSCTERAEAKHSIRENCGDSHFSDMSLTSSSFSSSSPASPSFFLPPPSASLSFLSSSSSPSSHSSSSLQKLALYTAAKTRSRRAIEGSKLEVHDKTHGIKDGIGGEERVAKGEIVESQNKEREEFIMGNVKPRSGTEVYPRKLRKSRQHGVPTQDNESHSGPRICSSNQRGDSIGGGRKLRSIESTGGTDRGRLGSISGRSSARGTADIDSITNKNSASKRRGTDSVNESNRNEGSNSKSNRNEGSNSKSYSTSSNNGRNSDNRAISSDNSIGSSTASLIWGNSSYRSYGISSNKCHNGESIRSPDGDECPADALRINKDTGRRDIDKRRSSGRGDKGSHKVNCQSAFFEDEEASDSGSFTPSSSYLHASQVNSRRRICFTARFLNAIAANQLR